MANEVVFTVPLIGSAIWTSLTGDTLLPSIVGAAFSVYFRHERLGAGALTIREIVAAIVISVVVGLLAGPYVADQLPDGQGVIGMGALIASFLGVPALRALSRLDIGKIVQSLADMITGGGKP